MISRKNKAWKRGQLWSLDLAASVFIFLVVLVALLFAWSQVNEESQLQVRLRRMESKALDMSDALIMTPGSPADWSLADVEVIGLSQEEGMLNASKVLSFIGMEYEQAKLKLGAGIYEFYFRLRDENNQTLQIDGMPAEAGSYPSDAELVVPAERYVVVDGTPATMEFMLWG